MQKHKYYGLIIILSLLTLYYKHPTLIILLTILPFIYYYINNKQKQAATEVLQNPEITTDINLKNAINAIPMPVVYIDNKKNLKFSNIDFLQTINKSAKNIDSDKLDLTIKNILLEAYINKDSFFKTINYKLKDYQVFITAIIDNDIYKGSILAFKDITQVTEGEKMQKRFIADASHELKTPITSILGMVEILNRKDFNDDIAREEFLIQIEKDSKRLDHLVKDLSLLSRIRENKLYLNKSVFSLSSLFEEIILSKKNELSKHNINVNLTCDRNIIVYGDQFRLSQVFINLFNNSINYTKDGTINISCLTSNNQVEIIFADNGKGISKDVLPHVFERFYRGESNRNRKGGGSGLGLAISKAIIIAHGGSISVKSTIDKGTTFTIKLTKS